MSVQFTSDDQCVFIETARESGVAFGGVDPFGMPASKLIAWLQAEDARTTTPDSTTLVSTKLGIAIYHPWLFEANLDPEEALEPVRSVAAFGRDYRFT